MNAHLIILVLALVGIGVSLYLNHERKRKHPPVCVIGNSCEKVWVSPYSYTFNVSNEILGIIFYSTVIVIEASLIFYGTFEYMLIGEYLMLVAGFAMSSYFLYIQWRVIRAWCFWCTTSAVVTYAMLATKIFS